MHQRPVRLAIRAEPARRKGRVLIDTPYSGTLPTLDPDHPLFGLGYAQPIARRAFVRAAEGTAEPASANIAEETPVALVYNGRPHVVMMCTPADIDDFALGFSLTEEIVARAADVTSVRAVRYSQGIEVEIAIPAPAAERLAARGRALVGRTGCGLCGVTTIADALRGDAKVGPGAALSVEALYRAGEELPGFQRYNDGTGAVHAAGWAGRDGRILVVREDVGRHNALDKLIGALTREGGPGRDGFVMVTSRASYELVQKCAVAGIGLLAAVSRPTDLAIRMAEAAGITLAGLVRGHGANVYTHPERLGFDRAGRTLERR